MNTAAQRKAYAGEASQDAFKQRLAALESRGIDFNALVTYLDKELKAERTQLIKMKKGANESKRVRLPRGVHIMYETTEEIVLAVDVVDWGTRQKARQDAHRLRGDYPPADTKKTDNRDRLDELIRSFAAGPVPRGKYLDDEE
ncbi:MAG: hypothetical protein ACLQDF_07115 [Desulfomonilia bacterium]